MYAGEETKTDAKALFEKKCIQCHTLDRPRSKKKTEKEWSETVMRMKNVNGAPITDEEAKIIRITSYNVCYTKLLRTAK